MTIRLSEVVPQLLAAAPALRPVADAIRRSPWHADRPEAYLAAFADHLVELLAGDETAQVPAILSTVERQLTEGDAVVRRHMGIFFLGMVLLAARRRSVSVAGLGRWFGPRTRREWLATTEFHRQLQSDLRASYRAPTHGADAGSAATE